MRQNSTGILYSNLFRLRLAQFLNRRHPLYRLADSINWSAFEKDYGALYIDNINSPGLPVRILIGLYYLKHTFNKNDESVIEQLLENPYWQYFCGFEYFQQELSFDQEYLVNWRKLIDVNVMDKLLAVNNTPARSEIHVSKEHSPQKMEPTITTVNPQALLRLPQVLALVPVSRASWLAGVRTGRYPQPIKLGPRTTCWKAADILALGGLKHL
jgi:predicted DNA-binding transcriptional regulator AlpA